MSRTVARLIPFYEFEIGEFFRSDGAPDDVASRRQDGFFALAATYKQRFAKGPGLDSLYGSTKVADDFNVANKVYAQAQPVDEYITAELTAAISGDDKLAATH